MNAECLMQWNRLKKEAGDFPWKLEREPRPTNTGKSASRPPAAHSGHQRAATCREHEDDDSPEAQGRELTSTIAAFFDEVCKNAGISEGH